MVRRTVVLAVLVAALACSVEAQKTNSASTPSAPVNASYVTLIPNATLTSEAVLAAGAGLDLVGGLHVGAGVVVVAHGGGAAFAEGDVEAEASAEQVLAGTEGPDREGRRPREEAAGRRLL